MRNGYFSNDPLQCVNCHIMRDEYDSWQHASHHAVAACNDCHIPHEFVGKYAVKAHNGFWHSYYFTFQNFHEPIQISDRNARILRANCLDCHRELMGEGALGPEQSLIVSTHRHAMLSIIDRLIVVDQGRIIADGPKAQILALMAGNQAKQA